MTDAELEKQIKTILCEKVELLTKNGQSFAQVEEIRKDIMVIVEVLKAIH